MLAGGSLFFMEKERVDGVVDRMVLVSYASLMCAMSWSRAVSDSLALNMVTVIDDMYAAATAIMQMVMVGPLMTFVQGRRLFTRVCCSFVFFLIFCIVIKQVAAAVVSWLQLAEALGVLR